MKDYIYLDYSATTPIDKEVLETYDKVSLDYIGNPNSLHKLGMESKKLMDASVKQPYYTRKKDYF